MGKASRVREQRSQQQKRQQQRNLWLATGGVVLAIIAMAAVLNRLNQAPTAPGPAKPTAADLAAPRSLRVAAAKVGFHPQLIPGVGEIEGKSASDAPTPTNTALLKPGTAAPAFSLKTPLGDTVSLSDYAGKALLVEFFATSCPHCQAEAPHLHGLYNSLDTSHEQMVSINADGEGAPSVYAFHRYFGLQYPALLDVAGKAGSWHSPQPPGPITKAYHIDSYPTFYVIAPDGTVHWASNGEQPTAKLKQELDQAAAGA